MDRLYIVTNYQNESSSTSVYDFASDIFLYHSIGSGESIRSIGSDYSKKTGLGYICRAEYNYVGKYYFSFSSRYDGSSVMGMDYKWGFFPSGAVMWKLSEEPFLKNSKVFYNTKLRASYGISGSDALGAYASHGRVTGSSSRGYAIDGTSYIGYRVSSLPVPDLMWEETTQFDLGFETSFFDGRIDFIFDYYHKNTTNLFLDVPVPQTSGVNQVTKNVGSLENKGYEFMVSAIPFSGKKFSYRTSFNIAFQQQEVTDIGDVEEIILRVAKTGGPRDIYQVKVGQPLGTFYGMEKEDGFWQVGDDFSLQFGSLAQPGDFKFVDHNNDGEITNLDRVVIGHAMPKFFGGWNNTLSYNGFDCSIFFDFIYGNDMYNAGMYRYVIPRIGDLNKLKILVDNYWTPENPNAEYPSMTSGSSHQHLIRDWNLEDASYFRFRELTMGYTLSSIKITKMRLFFNVTNLFTITKYTGQNPDANVNNNSQLLNMDYSGYPYYSTFTIGTNITF